MPPKSTQKSELKKRQKRPPASLPPDSDSETEWSSEYDDEEEDDEDDEDDEEDDEEEYSSSYVTTESSSYHPNRKDKEFENDLAILGQQMLTVCNDTNATSIKTKEGRVVKKLNERYTISDGDSFRKFVMENEAPELFEARISQSNFKQFIAERQQDGLPPGVNVMREFVVTVYKPTSD